MSILKKAAAKDLDYNIFVQLPESDKFIFVNDINEAPDKVILFSEWFGKDKRFNTTEYVFKPDFELFYYDRDNKKLILDKILSEKVA